MWRIFLCITLTIIGFETSFAETVPDVIITHHQKIITSVFTQTPTTTIDQHTIDQTGATNLQQVLQQTAEVSVQNLSGDGARMGFSIGGFGDNGSSNTLILVDHIPQMNPDLSNPTFTALPLQHIKRINILTGGHSVQYGDQSVGGVIDITTNKPQKNQQRLQIAYGSYHNQKYLAHISQQLNPSLTAAITGQFHSNDNYRQHNQLRSTYGNATIYFHHQQNQGYLAWQHFTLHHELPGALTIQQVRQDRRQGSTQEFNNQYHNQLVGHWQHLWQGFGCLTQSAFVRTMHGNGTYLGNFGGHFNEQRDVVGYAPNFSQHFYIGQQLLLNQWGLWLQRGQYDYQSASYHAIATQEQQALFTMVALPLTTKWRLSLGLRGAWAQSQLHNKTTNTKIHGTNRAVVGFIGARYYFNQNHYLFGQVSNNYRFPKPEENALTLDNKPLKTQLGTDYRLGYGLNHHNLHVSSYIDWLQLRREILFVPAVTTNFGGVNENLPPTRRIGLHLGSNYRITQYWQISGSYRYVHATFTHGVNRGKRIPFVPLQKIALSSKINFLTHWHSIIAGRYIGKRYPATDNNNNTRLLGGYSIFDFIIGYRWQHVYGNLRINNIFNKRYYAYAVAAQGTVYYYPAPGRNFMITLNYDF